MERYFDLYLNAGVSVPLVINANQYDKSETWLFTLYDETGIQFSPASGSIVGLKADGNTIMNAGTVNSSGQVVIQETEQMTAVAGKNEYELILDGTHGTANFVVLVERRPGDNAVPSESDISLISQAVQAASGIEAVLVLQNTVASLREEVNQWVAEHAGTTNETTLWEGDLDTDTPITLSHPATQYDVIAVYTYIGNSDNSATTPEAHYFRADEFKQGSVFISCGRADVETGASTEIVTETFRLITNTTGTTTTVRLDTRKEVRWNGQASSSAGITFPTMPSVMRITGIRTVQEDQEIIQARVGKDGTRYNTLKARLDAEEVLVDSSLTVQGAAADAKKTGDEISDLKSAIQQSSGLTADVKQALMDFANAVAFKSNVPLGQTYIDALEDALYPPANLSSISAVYTQSGTVYDTDTLDDLKSDLVVTAHYSDSTTSVVTTYVLSGTLAEGTSTITVAYGGKTATFDVTVTSLYLYQLTSPFTSTGTETLNTNAQLEVEKSYTILTDFIISSRSTSKTAIVYSTISGDSTTYIGLQTKDSYLWGMGVTWSRAKTIAAGRRYRYVAVVTVNSDGSSSVNGNFKDVTSGGTIQTATNTYSSGAVAATMSLGLPPNATTTQGFTGTVNDFKIFNGEMSSSDINDYLTNGAS